MSTDKMHLKYDSSTLLPAGIQDSESGKSTLITPSVSIDSDVYFQVYYTKTGKNYLAGPI
jgi:hypothetical protein